MEESGKQCQCECQRGKKAGAIYSEAHLGQATKSLASDHTFFLLKRRQSFCDVMLSMLS